MSAVVDTVLKAERMRISAVRSLWLAFSDGSYPSAGCAKVKMHNPLLGSRRLDKAVSFVLDGGVSGS